MKGWPAILALGLLACSQPAASIPAVKATESPASPSPEASPSQAVTPIPDLPVTTVAFRCQLPFYEQEGSTITDGFIAFPNGVVRVDPSSNNGLYYDMAYSRWLPVPREAIAPDGSRYAYVEVGQTSSGYLIHIVDVATGKNSVISQDIDVTKVSNNPAVFDFAPEGIYLVGAFEHIWPGVWLFDPVSGITRKVADVERPETIGPGSALWFGDVNAADPNPFTTASSAGILPDEVGRFDLKSATRATWLYRPGKSLEIIGADTFARPLILVTAPGGGGIGQTDFLDHTKSELLLGLSSTSQRSIYQGRLVETLGRPVADAHGVWFGSPQGIYLFSETRGLQKVSDHPGYPANGCF